MNRNGFRSEIKSRLKLNYATGKSPGRFSELRIAVGLETIAASDYRSCVEESKTGQVQVIENVEEVKSNIETGGFAKAGYPEALRETHIGRGIFRTSEHISAYTGD